MSRRLLARLAVAAGLAIPSADLHSRETLNPVGAPPNVRARAKQQPETTVRPTRPATLMERLNRPPTPIVNPKSSRRYAGSVPSEDERRREWDREREKERWFRYFNDAEDARRASQINPDVKIEPAKPLLILDAKPLEKPSAATNEAKETTDTEETPPEPEPAKTTSPDAADESSTNTNSSSEPSKPLAQPEADLSPELVALRAKVRRCLAWHLHHPAHASEHNPWEIMHAMLAFGVDTSVYGYDKKSNSIGYLCFNGPCRGQRLFHTDGNRLVCGMGPGLQGHEAQFLAMLAQSKLKKDYPIHADGRSFTVADLIQTEMLTCRPNTELTFKLISFSHYLESDRKWKSDDGQTWTIPRLIAEELAQPIIGAACGGTHRMMGFAYAVRMREKRGEPLTGEWLRAKKFLDSYHDYTFRMQNPDGSFSTNYFEARGDWGGIARRLETTGHILEWLSFSLSEKELRDPRMLKAADYLAALLYDHRNENWDLGPCGHAVHGLAIFDERLFGGQPGQREVTLAQDWKNRRQ